jgi:hypothetical protein
MSQVENAIIFLIVILGLMAIHIMTGPQLRQGFINVYTETVHNPVTPGNADLAEPRKPYHLLEWLPNASSDTIGSLNASCCNDTDFMARTNLTGNYLQRTNNYRHVYPDNCTGPLHDFTLAFYKPTALDEINS